MKVENTKPVENTKLVENKTETNELPTESMINKNEIATKLQTLLQAQQQLQVTLYKVQGQIELCKSLLQSEPVK